ncbi:MAG: hypothetical protein NT169_03325 [Chloroflexi bacterium]|nr:hypothetical protein [Chloroflexota bacterium]
MSDGVALTQKLQQQVLELPQESLPELEEFIEFLRFKFQARKQKKVESHPPLKIVKLGGILQGYDFSPEMLAEARREMWHKFYVEEQ